jgi:hypothetical protein
MRKVVLLAILMLAGLALRGDPADRNWAADPEWVKARYGAWGGPGVNAAPGPMDSAHRDRNVRAQSEVPGHRCPCSRQREDTGTGSRLGPMKPASK